ncbi:MAG TPA: multiheme c-type cytochrome [Pirellulaceae bacterium]|nr:multiheme c-type cytochrome [Pirellulaceae bacterium]
MNGKTIALLAYSLVILAATAFVLIWRTEPAGENSEAIESQLVNDNIDRSSAEDGLVSSNLTNNQNPHFEIGTECALCHAYSSRATAMRDSAGNNVAPYDLWEASMMAQSARDPYWRAVLSAEVHATPSQKAHIEDVCTRCHTPMAAPVSTSPKGEILAFLKADTRQSHLGLDGVSCTVCHQITDKNLGTSESFTGHFEINTESKIFGPHANPVTMPMQRHVSSTPTHSPHIPKSAPCATCQTVITDAVDADGAHAASNFHEQAPYLEWRNSVFNDEVAQPSPKARSCQACHMPTTDTTGAAIATMLAHNPGGRGFPFLNDRQPYGLHSMVGGNALMTRILRDNRAELGIKTPASAFDRSLERIQTFLRQETGSIEIGQITREGDLLAIPVTVRNRSGHKLPTAYPSRRLWVELTVIDAEGQTVFQSGVCNEQGELVDGQGNVLPSELAGGPILPHFNEIREPRQVQVYESIMADAVGDKTFYLLRGATFMKNNRLLPLGWDGGHADAEATKPAGIDGDPDFIGGEDQLRFLVPTKGTAPYRVHARLQFQTISPRHAAELFGNPIPEVRQFEAMYTAADRKPELIDEAEATVE